MHGNLEVRGWESRGDEATLGVLAESFAQTLQSGAVILLHGEMGAGKTSLTRAIARGLGVKRPQRVCSPTYQVAMEHPGPIPLIHVDLFRVGESDLGMTPAMQALGLDEDPYGGRSGVWVVEWGGYWKDPPADRFEFSLAAGDAEMLTRCLKMRAFGSNCAQQLKTWAQGQGAALQSIPDESSDPSSLRR